MILVIIVLYLTSHCCQNSLKLRLADYLSINNMLNSFQSAYIKHHSTETTLLSVYDHIIKAMNHQKVICLTLHDLSAAAFDTHSILLECLSSCIDISSTALSWIKSYLLNRSPMFILKTLIICIPTALWSSSGIRP